MCTKTLMLDTKLGVDEGKKSWYPELNYYSVTINGTFRIISTAPV